MEVCRSYANNILVTWNKVAVGETRGGSERQLPGEKRVSDW